MPYETIQLPSATCEDGVWTTPSGESEIAVHWNKEASWVQLHVQHYGGTPHEPCPLGCDGSSHPDTPCISTVDDPYHDIWSMPLSREQINHFIRALRRSRDQAFGRDE